MEKVVLVDLSDNRSWQLGFEPELVRLSGPDGAERTFTRSEVGSSCDFTTREDTCTVIMPMPGRVRTFRCSVNELQPLLQWIRLDLAPFERARLRNEFLIAVPLGAAWILAGSPVVQGGYAYPLIGYGAALVLLGIVASVRPHRYLLLVNVALWFGVAVQNARVAFKGSGVLAVVLTLFAASYAFRVLKLFVFHRALAQK